MAAEISDELRARIEAVTNKRARVVLDHIVEHGSITADDIQGYGYREHRRAVQDCRDLGFPIKNARVKSPQGGTVGVWSLDLDAALGAGMGRRQFPKKFRESLVARSGGRCESCGASEAMRTLQVDHRIPYAISPVDDLDPDAFQVLCGACNRSKSWTCEKECPNWEQRDPAVCKSCRWASPASYEHVATIPRREVKLIWDGEDVAAYDGLVKAAAEAGLSVPDYIQDRLGRE